MTSSLNSQSERLAFLEKQIDGHHWIFNGPEERAIMRELLAVVKETHETLRQFMKRFEETEG